MLKRLPLRATKLSNVSSGSKLTVDRVRPGSPMRIAKLWYGIFRCRGYSCCALKIRPEFANDRSGREKGKAGVLIFDNFSLQPKPNTQRVCTAIYSALIPQWKRASDWLVKQFLESLGFHVKGEIGGCDLVGIAEGSPPVVVIGELKLTFNLDLVLQGVDRADVCDEILGLL